MKVRVSRSFKLLSGKDWRKDAEIMVGEAIDCLAVDAEVTGRKCDTYEGIISLPVPVTVGKKRATVTVLLDCLSELDEYELPVVKNS